jgi:hypothetical protein
MCEDCLRRLGKLKLIRYSKVALLLGGSTKCATAYAVLHRNGRGQYRNPVALCFCVGCVSEAYGSIRHIGPPSASSMTVQSGTISSSDREKV